jgi:hypothetical protein
VEWFAESDRIVWRLASVIDTLEPHHGAALPGELSARFNELTSRARRRRLMHQARDPNSAAPSGFPDYSDDIRLEISIT